jgi:hypothetical protein
MKWIEEDIKLAINMLKNGSTYLEIGSTINRPQGSVRNKLNEFGLKFTLFNAKEKKYCLNCKKEVIDKRNTFCCSSCSATYNNKLRKQDYGDCKNCGKDLDKWGKKFCSVECAFESKREINIKKIEAGDTTLYFRNYKKYLIEKHGEKCMKCGWCEINKTTGNIPIQLEHIDGDSDNNSLNNLKLLCPNCHSLTPTYGALNKGNGRDSKRNLKRKNWRLNNEGNA